MVYIIVYSNTIKVTEFRGFGMNEISDLDIHEGETRIETVTFRSGNLALPEYRVRSHEILEHPQS